MIGTGHNTFANLAYSSGTNKTAQAVNIVPRRPNRTISKSASPTTGDAGDLITFTLTITNPNVGNAITGHTGVLNAAAFDAAGERVVTAGGDGIARIWQVSLERRSPEEIARFVGERVPLELREVRLVPRE